ncbi:AfsA-related hotdog domain-containing protein [Salinarimonas ramus]|uniref:A-factor biosynthesis protein AfsA n=1 Tax=Salinarimonas ramus TaxID=690164 RepID=A0A917QCG0_9HYPH|nr:AfsA-related hotdog domain-containing protein [Salinarimonas ramus]GGK43121.1 A-factor biosynthesis protein AfsA [Salinarimonas ramus]
MRPQIVVSDAFVDFADSCGVLTASALLARLAKGTVDAEETFFAAQGLCEAEKAQLREAARAAGVESAFAEWMSLSRSLPAPRTLTHKHRIENALVGRPALCADGIWRAELVMDARNELMSDHVTGQHVQGMVLVEACRQMFLAVSELAHMAPPASGGGRRTYVVFNSMNVGFKAFTFPLPATVEYRATSVDRSREDRVAIEAELAVVQNGEVTMTLSTGYTLFEPAKLQPKEIARGVAAVEALKARLLEPARAVAEAAE